MTFLNPFALFGLAAAAIPVLLHMLSMRRLRTIEFSSLRFLKELQQTRIRRLKIRQWLLLLLRTLVVMFLVLAFSRPTLQGLFGTASAGQARTTAVILLDDTPSMTATGPDGELFHRARAAAGRIIDLLRDGDEGILVPFSATDAPEVPEPTRSTAILRHTLEGLRTTPKSRTAEQALRVAARIMNVSKNFNKEVFLLSDLQASTLEMNPSAQSEKLFDERTRLFVLPLHAGDISNASVEQVRLPDAIREPGRPLRVLVRVANHSGREMNNRVVSLFLNGSRVAQRGVDISAGRSAEVEFMATPSQAGWVSGAAEIEEDDLPFDDHRSFAAFIPTAIRVACVGSPSDFQYIEMALSVRLADTLQLLHLTRIDVNRLTRSSLNGEDVVVLSDPGALSPASASALAEFVRNGGGMLLFTGPRTDPRLYTEAFSLLQAPAVVGIDRALASHGREAMPFVFDRVDWNHPIFHEMFESERAAQARRPEKSGERTLESPEIRTTVRFLPGPAAGVVIGLSNGAPFLIDEQSGRGRMLIFSVPATRAWSDLPTRGIFVTMLHRSILYAARRNEDPPAAIVGQPLRVTLHDVSQPRASVTDPLGVESMLPLAVSPNGALLNIASADLPGVYMVRAGGNIRHIAAVNADARESDIAPADDARTSALVRRLGLSAHVVRLLEPGDALTRTVLETRLGTELWRLFVILALLTALAEMAVARDSKRAVAEVEHAVTEARP